MTIYFAGAAAGSALSTVAWGRWKWDGVCGLAGALIALAAMRHAFGSRRPEPFNPDSRSEYASVDSAVEV
jgi:hypothetical protein